MIKTTIKIEIIIAKHKLNKKIIKMIKSYERDEAELVKAHKRYPIHGHKNHKIFNVVY